MHRGSHTLLEEAVLRSWLQLHICEMVAGLLLRRQLIHREGSMIWSHSTERIICSITPQGYRLRLRVNLSQGSMVCLVAPWSQIFIISKLLQLLWCMSTSINTLKSQLICLVSVAAQEQIDFRRKNGNQWTLQLSHLILRDLWTDTVAKKCCSFSLSPKWTNTSINIQLWAFLIWC